MMSLSQLLSPPLLLYIQSHSVKAFLEDGSLSGADFCTNNLDVSVFIRFWYRFCVSSKGWPDTREKASSPYGSH